MITPINPIVPPVITYDGIWLRNIQISAPDPSQPIRASIQACPFNSDSGSLNTQNTQQILIPDILATAATNPYVAAAMEAIYQYVQDQINSGSVTF